jgi:hypothetical protein
MMSVGRVKTFLREVSLGKEDVVELLDVLMGKKLTYWEIMEEMFRLRTCGRLRHYFGDTYYIHGRPFCQLLAMDINMLISVGILHPQKGKETFVVSPEVLLSWPIG